MECSRAEELAHMVKTLLCKQPQNPHETSSGNVHLQSSTPSPRRDVETEEALEAHWPASLLYTATNNKGTIFHTG